MEKKILALTEAVNDCANSFNEAHEALKKDLTDLKAENEIDIQIIPAYGVLANNREFRLIHLGKMPSITLNLPDKIPNVFKGKIIFRSSDKGCVLNIPGLTFVGDDCLNGQFVSTESKYYEIVYENLGPHSVASSSNQTPIILAKVTAFKL